MAGFGIQLNGSDKAKQSLKRMQQLQTPVKTAFVRAQSRLQAGSVREVPVDTGVLRASWVAPPPMVRPFGVTAYVGYGGAASRYAVVQHERLDYRHAVGKAKYLSDPFQRLQPQLVASLAKTVVQYLERMGAKNA